MRTYSVGIMLELMWPFRRHLDVFAGTQRFAKEAGDWICDIDESVHEDNQYSPSNLPSYDGLIARASAALAHRAQKAKVPLVNVWMNSPDADRLPGVFPDFAEVGRLACEHLHDRGFREFGCLSIPRERAHLLMVNSFHAAVENLGCHCNCAKSARFFHRNARSWARFQKMLDDWMSTWKPPIGVFVVFNDVTARYVVHACRRRGLRIPEDVALMTSTNEPTIGTMPPPSLSSVEVNYEHIGYQAAEILNDMMRKGKTTTGHHLVKPSGVLVRESTDFFAVNDEVVAFAMQYIEQHTRDRIAVDDVAAAARVSRRTLERRFQSRLGRSVAAEIRRLRILKAKRLLAETDLLIKQVARETGFRDPTRLHEIFVREEKTTPTEFRQNIRGTS